MCVLCVRARGAFLAVHLSIHQYISIYVYRYLYLSYQYTDLHVGILDQRIEEVGCLDKAEAGVTQRGDRGVHADTNP